MARQGCWRERTGLETADGISASSRNDVPRRRWPRRFGESEVLDLGAPGLGHANEGGMTKLTKPIARETAKLYGRSPVIVTLAPAGSQSEAGDPLVARDAEL